MVYERRDRKDDCGPTRIIYTDKAKKEIEGLDAVVAHRVWKKMIWFANQSNPLLFAKQLSGPLQGRWRFRVGDYRVICDVVDGRIRILRVLSVKHRKDVYRDLL